MRCEPADGTLYFVRHRACTGWLFVALLSGLVCGASVLLFARSFSTADAIGQKGKTGEWTALSNRGLLTIRHETFTRDYPGSRTPGWVIAHAAAFPSTPFGNAPGVQVNLHGLGFQLWRRTGGHSTVGNTYTSWFPMSEVVVPDVAMATVAAVMLVLAVLRYRRRPSLPGHCQRCGYDLRATVGRCPECGIVTA